MSSTITTIAFDADDTLWHNEKLFRFTESQFADMLYDYADKEMLEQRLLEIEVKNLRIYGYGIKGFTLSMIETAIEITKGRVDAKIIQKILDAGHAMHHASVETFAYARPVLQALQDDYRLILITKGDLFDQERKLAESGLGDFFTAVEVVSEKDRQTYEKLFMRHGASVNEAMMVGNSLKSDVIPALEAGAWGIYIPYEVTWVLEKAEEPLHMARFRKLETLKEFIPLLQSL